MIGVELRHSDASAAGDIAGRVLVEMMKRGIFMLADGPEGNVLAFTPPFTMQDDEFIFVMEQLQDVLYSLSGLIRG